MLSAPHVLSSSCHRKDTPQTSTKNHRPLSIQQWPSIVSNIAGSHLTCRICTRLLSAMSAGNPGTIRSVCSLPDHSSLTWAMRARTALDHLLCLPFAEQEPTRGKNSDPEPAQWLMQLLPHLAESTNDTWRIQASGMGSFRFAGLAPK